MSIGKKKSAVRPHEVCRHTISKVRGAVSLTRMLEDKKAGNTVMEF